MCYRTIDKYGGLDAYLLGTTDEKLASDVGSELKQQIRAALALQKQQRKNGVQSATVGPHRGLCYVMYIAFPEENHLSERNLFDMGNATKIAAGVLGQEVVGTRAMFLPAGIICGWWVGSFLKECAIGREHRSQCSRAGCRH